MTDTLPASMSVIEISEFGGPEVLKPAQRELPEPEPNEVLIQVAWAGVNRPDCAQRAGNYAPPPGASDLPGLEISGTVIGIGNEVSRWHIGDRPSAREAPDHASGLSGASAPALAALLSHHFTSSIALG